jgi:hypothetical protein
MFFSEDEEMYMLWLAYNLEQEALASDEEEEEGVAPEEEPAGANEPNGGQEADESK